MQYYYSDKPQIIIIAERPNHSLFYTVGNDFCIEDVDSILPDMTLECSLSNIPDPPPNFSFTVERILVSNNLDSEMLQMQMSNESILQLNETALLSLFDLDTKSITVTCEVSNTFGVAGINTIITICGTYGLCGIFLVMNECCTNSLYLM